MPNLFKVDFVQGKTDASDYNQVKHSLIDTLNSRVIIDLSMSADRLQAVSVYAREPKRLVFECYPTAWISEYLLSGNYEHERYISHYEVKVYRDSVLIFSGIIDTSQLVYDVGSETIKVTCYDKIKLLSLYSDLTHYYSLSAGYTPAWILGYYIQDIQQKMAVSMPYSDQMNMAAINISSGNPQMLAQVDYDDMVRFPNPTGGWVYSYHASGDVSPYYGYIIDSTSGVVSFVFATQRVIQAVYPSPAATRYQGRYRVRIYKYFNNICPVIYEYEKQTDWLDSLSGITTAYNEYMSFITGKGIALGSLTSTASIAGRAYTLSHFNNNWVQSYFSGNLMPSKLFPGKSYTTFKEEQTANLKTLKAMLMLYNATLFCSPSGVIVLKDKGQYGAVIDINSNDVLSFSRKRQNQEVPDVSQFEILAGDTTVFQSYVKSALMEFYSGKWVADITIDQIDKYELQLQGKIRIDGVIYAIVELLKDVISDEFKVKAWQL